MKFGIVVILLGMIQLTWWIREVNCGEAEDCKAGGGNMMKKQMKLVNECTSSLKFKDNKEKKRKQSCIMKCVLSKGGLLNAEGMVDLQGARASLKEFFAEVILDKAETALKACEQFMKQVDPKEELCKSYEPLIACGTKALAHICK